MIVEQQQQQQQRVEMMEDMDSDRENDGGDNGMLMARLPTLKEAAAAGADSEQQAQLLLKKLRQCQQQLPWQNGEENDAELEAAREVKAGALREVVEWIGSNQTARELLNVDGTLQEELVAIVRANLFKPLPPNEISAAACEMAVDPEEMANGGGACQLAPDWPHLQLVYRLLLHLIDQIDLSQRDGLHRHIDGTFVGHILARFHSTDPREREQLKAVLHALYSRMVPLRGESRKRMGWLLLGHVYERQSWLGLAELMEILGNIVNGFNVPLKVEHRVFFLRVLLPLHKPHGYIAYFAQLAYCVALFLEKDPSLAMPIIEYLLKNWPRGCAAKEVLFMAELEELLARIEPNEFQGICVPLFRQLAKCASSQHYRVAERALNLWSNEKVLELVKPNSRLLMPIMFQALYTASDGHWNATIAALVFKTMKKLMALDAAFFDELVMNHEKEQMRRQKRHSEYERLWERLNETAMEEEVRQREKEEELREAEKKITARKTAEGEGKENQQIPAVPSCIATTFGANEAGNSKNSPSLEAINGTGTPDEPMKETTEAGEEGKAEKEQIRRKQHDTIGGGIGAGNGGMPRRKLSGGGIGIGTAAAGYRRSSSESSFDSMRLRRVSTTPIAAYSQQQKQHQLRCQQHMRQQQHVR